MDDLNNDQERADNSRQEGLQLVEYPNGRRLDSMQSDQSSVVDSFVETYYSQFRWVQVDEQTNLYTNMFQAIVQILIMFAVCVSDESADPQSEIYKRSETWVGRSFDLFALCLFGFLLILCLTYKDRRTSRRYVFKMILFMIFQSIVFMLIFEQFVEGLDIRYGNQFVRKIFAYDPVEREYKFVLNSNKVKIGNMTAEEMMAFRPEDEDDLIDPGILTSGMKGHFTRSQNHLVEKREYELRMEPRLVFLSRMFFLCLALVFQTVLIAILFTLLLFLCIMFVQKGSADSHHYNPNSVNIRRILRQGRLIKAMRELPYSQFMLREASECPICLETFEQDSQVVQLKCSKYHIYHAKCLKAYVEVPGPPKKCPLCRMDIKIQDPPIID